MNIILLICGILIVIGFLALRGITWILKDEVIELGNRVDALEKKQKETDFTLAITHPKEHFNSGPSLPLPVDKNGNPVMILARDILEYIEKIKIDKPTSPMSQSFNAALDHIKGYIDNYAK